MAQSLVQRQEQKLLQQQRLTQQQMMVVRMLEMPLAEFEQAVKTEIDDNPALEVSPDNPELSEYSEESEYSDNSDHSDSPEEQERQSELDSALERMTGDDDMPLEPENWNLKPGTSAEADYEEITYGNQISFYDTLKEQMGELELSNQQRQVMEYIIGSLDDDGLLRKSLDSITDELAIYQNIDVSEKEVEEILKLLQTTGTNTSRVKTLQEFEYFLYLLFRDIDILIDGQFIGN